jgi:hypothetical protein
MIGKLWHKANYQYVYLILSELFGFFQKVYLAKAISFNSVNYRLKYLNHLNFTFDLKL